MEPLNQLLQTEMSRKQFLAYLGTVIITLIGIPRILNALNTHDLRPAGGDTAVTYGGSSSTTTHRWQ